MPSILIGGDLAPHGVNERPFQQGDPNVLCPQLQSAIAASACFVVNLECPLIDQSSSIPKAGPRLRASSGCARGLKAIKATAVGLANNHIMDEGLPGLESVLGACRENDIATFGAGMNVAEARKPWIARANGLEFGFVGVAENEFMVARTATPGVNPIDPIEITRYLPECRRACDFLTVLVHGGREHYPYPSPRLQNLCRFLAEQGAQAVIAQHSHCIGSYERYREAVIVYGQGNLLFNRGSLGPLGSQKYQDHVWYTGMLVQLVLDDRAALTGVNWIPCVQTCGIPGVRQAAQPHASEIIRAFEQRSAQILDPAFVDREWHAHSLSEKYHLAGRLRGWRRLLRYINRKTHLTDFISSPTRNRIVQNAFQSETQRDMIETLWGNNVPGI